MQNLQQQRRTEFLEQRIQELSQQVEEQRLIILNYDIYKDQLYAQMEKYIEIIDYAMKLLYKLNQFMKTKSQESLEYFQVQISKLSPEEKNIIEQLNGQYKLQEACLEQLKNVEEYQIVAEDSQQSIIAKIQEVAKIAVDNIKIFGLNCVQHEKLKIYIAEKTVLLNKEQEKKNQDNIIISNANINIPKDIQHERSSIEQSANQSKQKDSNEMWLDIVSKLIHFCTSFQAKDQLQNGSQVGVGFDLQNQQVLQERDYFGRGLKTDNERAYPAIPQRESAREEGFSERAMMEKVFKIFDRYNLMDLQLKEDISRKLKYEQQINKTSSSWDYLRSNRGRSSLFEKEEINDYSDGSNSPTTRGMSPDFVCQLKQLREIEAEKIAQKIRRESQNCKKTAAVISKKVAMNKDIQRDSAVQQEMIKNKNEKIHQDIANGQDIQQNGDCQIEVQGTGEEDKIKTKVTQKEESIMKENQQQCILQKEQYALSEDNILQFNSEKQQQNKVSSFQSLNCFSQKQKDDIDNVDTQENNDNNQHTTSDGESERVPAGRPSQNTFNQELPVGQNTKEDRCTPLNLMNQNAKDKKQIQQKESNPFLEVKEESSRNENNNSTSQLLSNDTGIGYQEQDRRINLQNQELIGNKINIIQQRTIENNVLGVLSEKQQPILRNSQQEETTQERLQKLREFKAAQHILKAETNNNNNQRQRSSSIFTYVEQDFTEIRQKQDDSNINHPMDKHIINPEITNIKSKEDLQLHSSRPPAQASRSSLLAQSTNSEIQKALDCQINEDHLTTNNYDWDGANESEIEEEERPSYAPSHSLAQAATVPTPVSISNRILQDVYSQSRSHSSSQQAEYPINLQFNMQGLTQLSNQQNQLGNRNNLHQSFTDNAPYASQNSSVHSKLSRLNLPNFQHQTTSRDSDQQDINSRTFTQSYQQQTWRTTINENEINMNLPSLNAAETLQHDSVQSRGTMHSNAERQSRQDGRESERLPTSNQNSRSPLSRSRLSTQGNPRRKIFDDSRDNSLRSRQADKSFLAENNRIKENTDRQHIQLENGQDDSKKLFMKQSVQSSHHNTSGYDNSHANNNNSNYQEPNNISITDPSGYNYRTSTHNSNYITSIKDTFNIVKDKENQISIAALQDQLGSSRVSSGQNRNNINKEKDRLSISSNNSGAHTSNRGIVVAESDSIIAGKQKQLLSISQLSKMNRK